MAVHGPNNPIVCANDASTGVYPWVQPAKALNDDGSGASASVRHGGLHTNTLKPSGFGFAIPANATITGIGVTIKRSCSGVPVRDSRVSLVKGGVVQPYNRAAAEKWTSRATYKVYGNQSDLWDEPWTAEEINDPAFGVAIAAVSAGDELSGLAKVDAVTVTIYTAD